MTDAQRAELRRLCEAATPGEWLPGGGHGWPKGWARILNTPDDEDVVWPIYGPGRNIPDDDPLGVAVTPADQMFIAAARTALPALLDELEAVESKWLDVIKANAEVASANINLLMERDAAWNEAIERAYVEVLRTPLPYPEQQSGYGDYREYIAERLMELKRGDGWHAHETPHREGASVIYLASSWKNRERVRELAIELRKATPWEVYDFTDPACRKAPEIPPEKYPDAFDPEVHRYREYLDVSHWREAVAGNRAALDRARAVVLMLPCGNDSHADWAYGVGRGAISCVVGHPHKGERTPSHWWADAFLDYDNEVVPWLVENLKERT